MSCKKSYEYRFNVCRLRDVLADIGSLPIFSSLMSNVALMSAAIYQFVVVGISTLLYLKFLNKFLLLFKYLVNIIDQWTVGV